jgi:TRAP-type C4-dicarboxylate transport system permease large subunit
MVITAICAIYVILGTAMEELSMILLTVPVFFPLVVHLGFDPIWFGILIVVVVEIGLISPPVGMNLFVLNALLPQVSTRILFEGVMPFVVADIVRLGISLRFRRSRCGCPASCGDRAAHSRCSGSASSAASR